MQFRICAQSQNWTPLHGCLLVISLRMRWYQFINVQEIVGCKQTVINPWYWLLNDRIIVNLICLWDDFDMIGFPQEGCNSCVLSLSVMALLQAARSQHFVFKHGSRQVIFLCYLCNLLWDWNSKTNIPTVSLATKSYRMLGMLVQHGFV